MSRADGRGVHERLEGRARLADSLRGAVVLGVVEVAPTDHRPDVPGARLQRDEGSLQVVSEGVVFRRPLGGFDVLAVRGPARELAVRVHSRLDGVELRLDGALRRLLHVEVERRVDTQASLIQVAPEARIELHPQPFDEIGRDVSVVRPVAREDQGIRLPELDLVLREEALVVHQPQHDVAPAHGPLGVRARVVERGELGQRRECGRFRDVQLGRVLAEVDLRRGLDSVGPGAEVDLVEIQLEDRVLGKVALDLHGHPRFLELPGERLLAADLLGEDVPRQLHGDRREPLRKAHRHEVVLDGAEDAPIVDPVMLVEALVFGGDEGLADGERDLAQRQHGAPLGTELADQPAVRGEHLGRLHLDVAAPAAGVETRDAGAMLARAHAGPGAVREPQAVRGDQHRDRDYTAAGLLVLPPGEGLGQRDRRGRWDRRHRATT